MAKLDISNAHKQILAELYEQARLTVDQLPYADEFERLTPSSTKPLSNARRVAGVNSKKSNARAG